MEEGLLINMMIAPKQEVLNVAIISDVHLETWDTGRQNSPEEIYANTNCDTLVIAGDFGYVLTRRGRINQRFLDVLRKLKSIYEHVVYVSGNHEYYSQEYTISFIDETLKQVCDQIGVHFLQKDTWKHPSTDVLFVGCTLWTDVVNNDEKSLTDFSAVFGRNLLAWRALHKDHQNWLHKTLATHADQPIIVISHHLPSYQLINEKFLFCGGNSGFASHSEWLIELNQRHTPLVGWICGHSHDPIDYEIKGVPIRSNPFDYKHDYLKHQSKRPKPRCYTFPLPGSPFQPLNRCTKKLLDDDAFSAGNEEE